MDGSVWSVSKSFYFEGHTCFDAFINLFLDISEKLTNSIQILNSTQLTCFVHSSPLFISNENFRREKRFDFC